MKKQLKSNTKHCVIETGFFRLARLVSLKSNYRVKLGCVIVQHGKPISIGFNRVKTHPISGEFTRTLHAEMDALISARAPLDGATVFVYRERANGDLGLAKPCKNCYKKLVNSGVKKIYYSTTSGYGVIIC